MGPTIAGAGVVLALLAFVLGRCSSPDPGDVVTATGKTIERAETRGVETGERAERGAAATEVVENVTRANDAVNRPDAPRDERLRERFTRARPND